MSKKSNNTKIDFTKVQKILIVRLGKIGDLIVTSFVFEVIKNAVPNSEIHLLTVPSNRDVIKYNPNLSKTFYFNKNLFLYLKLHSVRKENYDVIIDFNDNPSTTSKIIFKLINARIKAGYNFTKYKEVINYRIEPLEKEETHIIERMKNFLSILGINVDENLVKPFFYLGSEELSEVKKEINAENKSIIAINISAGAQIRCWSAQNWIYLIQTIQRKYINFSFIILSSTADLVIKKEIASTLNLEINNISKLTSIQHFAAFIKCSKLLITPDTSAVHIASAFGIPTVALFPNSKWNFASWQPYHIPSRTIKSSTENINDISVEEVFSKFQSLIKEIGLI